MPAILNYFGNNPVSYSRATAQATSPAVTQSQAPGPFEGGAEFSSTEVDDFSSMLNRWKQTGPRT